jgi:cysteine desulfurase
MASLTSSVLRTASRLGSGSSVAAAPVRRLSHATAIAAVRRAGSRRTYVSESKRDNARVETAIKLDKKDFADIPPPQMDTPANAKVSPMAGKCILPRNVDVVAIN